MRENHTFIFIVLIVIAADRISVGLLTCRGRENLCPWLLRPNCLEKNKQPYFQCTPKNESCGAAWQMCCRRPYVLSCYDRHTYCDCYCFASQGIRPKPGPLPKRINCRAVF
uniref:Putative secreted peptide n=1 Tax=Rhipicephalus pulchellus TaxID=72859 RepID=L7M939_RHIPC